MHMMTINTKSTLFILAFSLALTPFAQALELVIVERKGCVYCEKWDAEVAPEYPKTERGKAAPLRRIDIDDVNDALTLERKVVFTPTFLFIEDDTELKRLEGYISEDFFWALGEEFVASYKGASQGNGQ